MRRISPIRCAVPAVLAAALLLPACSPAQVSLLTVVDLAQRQSTAVRLAEADERKAAAALSETKDVYIPSLLFGSGLPALPSVGFTGSPSSIWSGTVQSLVFSISQKQYISGAAAGVRAAQANLKDAREQAALDAATAYIELDTVNRELALAHQQETDAGRMVEIEQQRAEAGVDSLNDFLQAQLNAWELKLKRIHLETRAATLTEQLATLTGLPESSITPDHGSIPEIPAISGDVKPLPLAGIESARLAAKSRQSVAAGDEETNYLPQFSFFAQYNRNTTLLNNADYYYAHNLPASNFSSGFSIQVPLFDMGHRAKARESAAEALRARVEAEQAEHQNEIQVATLTGSIRELEAQAAIATLKQQIAANNLKTVAAQLEYGNGTGSGPGSTPQLSPKAEQLAQIDASEKQQEALDAGFELARARLGLLRALGHMQDWLNELHGK
ncbi:MAG TPA: TolC family protein [Terracidiphilus sp.]|nr:TolC family protein [Terracidiphilus sp.]